MLLEEILHQLEVGIDTTLWIVVYLPYEHGKTGFCPSTVLMLPGLKLVATCSVLSFVFEASGFLWAASFLKNVSFETVTKSCFQMWRTHFCIGVEAEKNPVNLIEIHRISMLQLLCLTSDHLKTPVGSDEVKAWSVLHQHGSFVIFGMIFLLLIVGVVTDTWQISWNWGLYTQGTGQ